MTIIVITFASIPLVDMIAPVRKAMYWSWRMEDLVKVKTVSNLAIIRYRQIDY